MRAVNLIIIHCAATFPGQDIGVEEIRRWHLERGFDDIGYHGVILRDGTLESGRDLDRAGAHTTGHNAKSVGICLVGGLQDGKGGDANGDGLIEEFENGQKGVPEANYTPAQWETLERVVRDLLRKFPGARVAGHNEFAAKACPCFKVPEWWAKVQGGA